MLIKELIFTFAARNFKDRRMNVVKDYHISFSGLKDGEHAFKFEIGQKFFTFFKNSRIHDSEMELQIFLHKQDGMLQFDFEFDGKIEVECDRCIELFWLPLKFEEMLIVKFGPENREEAENILVFNESEHEIHLEQFIYEFISLAMPMRLVHPEDKDGEYSCELEIFEENNDDLDPDQEVIDPRWEALKKLKKE